MKITVVVKRVLTQHAEILVDAESEEAATEDISHQVDTPMHNARLQKNLSWYNADISPTTILGAIGKD